MKTAFQAFDPMPDLRRYTVGAGAPLDVHGGNGASLSVVQDGRTLLVGRSGDGAGLRVETEVGLEGRACAQAVAAAAAAVLEVDLAAEKLPLDPAGSSAALAAAVAYGIMPASGAPRIRRRQLLQQPLLWHQDPRPLPYPHLPCRTVEGRTHPERPTLPQGVVYDRFDPLLGMRMSFRRVDLARDLAMFHAWMNDMRVAYFWELAQSEAELAGYLTRLEADPHAWPLIGCFDGEPAGYFEVYWGKEDRLGPYYDAHDYDRGWHGLIGDRRHLGTAKTAGWLRGLTHFLFLDDPRTEKMVGEPRVDSVKLLRYADALAYEKVKEFDFPHKRAALMHCWRERFFAEVLR